MRLNSGLSLPTAAPPLPADPAPLARSRLREAGTWFEVTSPLGPVRLCVDVAAEPALHAAQAAVVLHRVEPLLGALELWRGSGLDWTWIEAPEPPDEATTAVARCQPPGAPECRLVWPLALLRTMPPPPPFLAAALDWPLVPAVLGVARLQLDAEDFACLEPGGAVLIPASLQGPWRGFLRGAAEPSTAAGVAVDLSTPWRPKLAERAGGPQPPTALDPLRTACELRLDLPLGVSAVRLAGWRREGDGGELVHLAEAGLRVALWCCATPRQSERPLAAGRLMPWGDGWAFAIESLADDFPAPPLEEAPQIN